MLCEISRFATSSKFLVLPKTVLLSIDLFYGRATPVVDELFRAFVLIRDANGIRT